MTNLASCNSLPASNQSDLLPIAEGDPATDVAMTGGSPSVWRDLLGITASIACAIHCAAMPFVIGFLPAFGLSFLADESFHKWMAGACFLIALVSFLPGWRRHRRCLPAAVAATGLTIITAAAFGLSGECCAACDSNVEITSAQDSAEAVPPCCEHCEHCVAETSTSAAKTEQSLPTVLNQAQASLVPAFITQHAAWWTPIGGMLLVFGHLLNRCFVSNCVCCDPKT